MQMALFKSNCTHFVHCIFHLASRNKPTEMGTASHTDPKDVGVFSALPVLLRFPPSIGKKCNTSDMLDGENVQASNNASKKAKVSVQISPPSNRPPLPPISILQSHDSKQEDNELELSEEHLSEAREDYEVDGGPDDTAFEQ